MPSGYLGWLYKLATLSYCQSSEYTILDRDLSISKKHSSEPLQLRSKLNTFLDAPAGAEGPAEGPLVWFLLIREPVLTSNLILTKIYQKHQNTTLFKYPIPWLTWFSSQNSSFSYYFQSFYQKYRNFSPNLSVLSEYKQSSNRINEKSACGNNDAKIRKFNNKNLDPVRGGRLESQSTPLLLFRSAVLDAFGLSRLAI